ncbi:MAG TPA: hypothetical protein ENH94_03135 [Phycisphaerales bacterium]|nr:hypothetical protein [Phycisphaerales bacterium]
MAENGIVNNLGVSRRSLSAITAMGMIMKLSASDGKYVAGAMVGIIIVAVVYMVLDEIKDRRKVIEKK